MPFPEGGEHFKCGQILRLEDTTNTYRKAAVNLYNSCKISDFHGDNYEECCLLGCDANMALVRTEASEEIITSTIRVTRIGELETLAVTSNRPTFRTNVWPPSSGCEASAS
jgi:hypothetical protein